MESLWTGTTPVNLQHAIPLPLDQVPKKYNKLMCQLPSHLLVKSESLPLEFSPEETRRKKLKLDRKAKKNIVVKSGKTVAAEKSLY